MNPASPKTGDKTGEKRRRDSEGSGAPCGARLREDDEKSYDEDDDWDATRAAMFDMSMDMGHKLVLIVAMASLLDKGWTYEGNANARRFMEDVSSFGRFSPELKDDPSFQPSKLEKCLRFVQCQAFLNALELGACSSDLSDDDQYKLGLHAFGLALSKGTSGSCKLKVFADCPIAKELKRREDVVFVLLTGCLQQVISRPSGRGLGVVDVLAEEEEKKEAEAPLGPNSGPVEQQQRSSEQNARETVPQATEAKGAVPGAVFGKPATSDAGCNTEPIPAAPGASGGASESSVGGGSDDVSMQTGAGGVTSSAAAAPQGPESGPVEQQQCGSQQSARKRKSGALRRKQRKQRMQTVGEGAAQASSASPDNRSQDASTGPGGATGGKAAHTGAIPKPQAPALQSSSKHNAWQSDRRKQHQGGAAGQHEGGRAAPATAAAAQRHWGPGPVYRFVGEKAPAGVPATTAAAAGVRAPQQVPAVAAAERATVKVPPRVVGHIACAGDAAAGGTATASQLTTLFLTVISAALQGILKQSASGGERVDVVVDEGV